MQVSASGSISSRLLTEPVPLCYMRNGAIHVVNDNEFVATTLRTHDFLESTGRGKSPLLTQLDPHDFLVPPRFCYSEVIEAFYAISVGHAHSLVKISRTKWGRIESSVMCTARACMQRGLQKSTFHICH